MGAWIISQLERGQELIKAAPVLVLALVVLGFIGGYYFFRERMNILEERLKAKDEQIGEYRQRLHLVPVGQTSYSKLTNAELKQEAMRVVSGVRELLNRRSEEMRMTFVSPAAMEAAKSEEERRQLWNRKNEQLAQIYFRQISDYESKFRMNAILLRDELLTRLPKEARNDRIYARYEHSGSAEVIVDDLERMAKLLPD